MLRIVVALLLVANAVLLGWQAGLFGTTPERGQREPERLARQLHPEQVRVLSPMAASAALADAARAVADAASQAASAASSTAGAAAPAAAATSAALAAACLEAGPFAAAEVGRAEKLLRAELPAGSWQPVKVVRKGSYMIYVGRFTDEAALARRREELREIDVLAEPVANWPGLEPGLVLARFDDRAEADSVLSALVQRGVRKGRVVTIAPPVTLSMLRVAAADPALQARVATLKLPPTQLGFAPCGSPAAKP
jgi:hypothetical protein